MKVLVLMMMLLSLGATAHIKMGRYVGVTAEGEKCTLFANLKFYKNHYKSAYNEVLHVYVDRRLFELTHPVKYDFETGEHSVDKSRLTKVYHTPKGINALELTMIHSDAYNGPGQYTLHRDDQKSYVCADLKYVSTSFME